MIIKSEKQKKKSGKSAAKTTGASISPAKPKTSSLMKSSKAKSAQTGAVTSAKPAKVKSAQALGITFGSNTIDEVPPVGQEWWAKGVRFECQGSGNCCVSRGEYGFVYMTLKDRKRMAADLKMPLADFTKKYCAKTDGVHHLIDGKGPECVFLVDSKCSVYHGRPDQCRSWPFWPEVMSAKRWKKEVATFCPGIGKGRVWEAEEIREILDVQSKSEYDLVTGN